MPTPQQRVGDRGVPLCAFGVSEAGRTGVLLAAIAAACAPSLLAYNVSPSPTFLNQALALALWGVFVALAALADAAPQRLAHSARAAWLPLAALALLAASVLWSWGPGSLPSGLALSALGMLLASALLVLGGAAARGGKLAVPLFVVFCVGWVVAGVLNASIGIVQVFVPSLPDGSWIARSGLPGRAVGNLRQPNHLSSLLLWSAIAVVPLVEMNKLSRRAGNALYALMMFAVVLTASRTGVVGVALLTIWGLLDKRLSRPTRRLLVASPLLYLVGWLAVAGWAELSHHVFGAEARLDEADLSSSRFGIWANTLALIRQQPWTGVGFGEFNLAWTLTPFPGRPTAFFDHTHNLILQFAVELGLPLAAAVLGLLLVAIWRGWRLCDVSDDATAVTLRSGWMMLLLIGVHSQLEYPLWYAYFLLPTAWLFGYALGRAGPPTAPVAEAETHTAAARPRALFIGGMLLTMGAALSVVDYARVTMIFAPPSSGDPLSQRIATGWRSVLFAHHADYADVTTESGVAPPGKAFSEAPHYLMDTRLMIAWAKALAAAGQTDKARYLAQRLREFRKSDAADFFAPCDAPEAGQPLPFQCQPPQRAWNWRDFVD